MTGWDIDGDGDVDRSWAKAMTATAAEKQGSARIRGYEY